MHKRQISLGIEGEKWLAPIGTLSVPVDEETQVLVYEERGGFTILYDTKAVHVSTILEVVALVHETITSKGKKEPTR